MFGSARFKALVVAVWIFTAVVITALGQRQVLQFGVAAKCVGAWHAMTGYAMQAGPESTWPSSPELLQRLSDCHHLNLWLDDTVRMESNAHPNIVASGPIIEAQFTKFETRVGLRLLGLLSLIVLISIGLIYLLTQKNLPKRRGKKKGHQTSVSQRMSPLSAALHDIAETESIRAGCPVELEIDGDERLCVTDVHYPLIEASISELVRNSIRHGGRNSAQRLQAGKPESLKVFVGVKLEQGNWRLTVADDGEAIDEMSIIQHASACGLISREMIRELATGEGVKLILLPGFSDANESNFGPLKSDCLASIKQSVELIGGSLSLRNRPQVFCEFTFMVPALAS